MRTPSGRIFVHSITITPSIASKDVDVGRAIAPGTPRTLNCAVESGDTVTSVDGTTRWTTEDYYTVGFPKNPGIKPHDTMVWIDEGGTSHTLVCLGQTSVRYGAWDVRAIERT